MYHKREIIRVAFKGDYYKRLSAVPLLHVHKDEELKE